MGRPGGARCPGGGWELGSFGKRALPGGTALTPGSSSITGREEVASDPGNEGEGVGDPGAAALSGKGEGVGDVESLGPKRS